MEIKDLLGKTLIDVKVDKDQTEMIFSTNTDQYKMWHRQDCCEGVYIEDIVGDLEDLVGHPITLAEEMTNTHNADMPNMQPKEDYEESYTWTFYKLATIKGYVDIRWYGSSNGYYSESVDFCKIGSQEDY